MAERCGLSPHTLRYYERIGLIQAVCRDPGGQRRYSAQDIDWIAFLNRLRATGMPIRLMLKFAALRRAGEPSVPERRALLEAHMKQVRAHIDELEFCVAALQDKVEHYRQVESSMTSTQPTATRKGNAHGRSLPAGPGKTE